MGFCNISSTAHLKEVCLILTVFALTGMYTDRVQRELQPLNTLCFICILDA